MKNFVFDLYGTLVDIHTDESDLKFRKKFLEEYGGVFGGADFFNELNAYIRAECEKDKEREPDLLHAFKAIACAAGKEISDGEAERMAQRFRELSRSRLRLYPLVISTLAALKRAGAGIYILSNAQRCFTMAEIEKLGIDKFADGIELSSDFGYKKPSPKFFNHILDKYALSCGETVYIGNDFGADVVGAKGVNLRAVYIKSNISPRGDSVKEAAKVADYATASRVKLKKILLNLALNS